MRLMAGLVQIIVDKKKKVNQNGKKLILFQPYIRRNTLNNGIGGCRCCLPLEKASVQKPLE